MICQASIDFYNSLERIKQANLKNQYLQKFTNCVGKDTTFNLNGAFIGCKVLSVDKKNETFTIDIEPFTVAMKDARNILPTKRPTKEAERLPQQPTKPCVCTVFIVRAVDGSDSVEHAPQDGFCFYCNTRESSIPRGA